MQCTLQAMAALLQLLILASVAVLAVAPCALIATVVRAIRHQATWRSPITLLAFHAGTLLVGWLVWRELKPDGWALSFWATVLAGMDSETYGHVIEHAAEVVAAKVIVFAVFGGVLLSGLTALGSYAARRRAFRLERPV